MHNVTRIRSESIARYKKHIYGAKDSHRDRFVSVHQTDQIGIDAATHRYSNNESVQLICYRLIYYRP